MNADTEFSGRVIEVNYERSTLLVRYEGAPPEVGSGVIVTGPDGVEQAREALRLCIVCLTTNYKATPGLWTSADADALAKATTVLAALGVKASQVSGRVTALPDDIYNALSCAAMGIASLSGFGLTAKAEDALQRINAVLDAHRTAGVAVVDGGQGNG